MRSDTAAALAANTKRLMAEREWTQRELGKHAGLSQRAVGYVLNYRDANDRHANLETIDKIARAFGISAPVLLSEGKPLSRGATVTNILVRQRVQPAAKQEAFDNTALLKLILQQMRSVKGLSSRQRDTLILKIFSLYSADNVIPAPAQVLQLIRSA